MSAGSPGNQRGWVGQESVRGDAKTRTPGTHRDRGPGVGRIEPQTGTPCDDSLSHPFPGREFSEVQDGPILSSGVCSFLLFGSPAYTVRSSVGTDSHSKGQYLRYDPVSAPLSLPTDPVIH